MRPSVVRQRTGGRPSKGNRKDVRARPPVDVAEQVDALSLSAGVPITDFAAALIEIGLRHLQELPANLQPKEVLPEAG